MYLISKALDPVFALAIGLSAAALRIRREERARGRELPETLALVRTRAARAWERGFDFTWGKRT